MRKKSPMSKEVFPGLTKYKTERGFVTGKKRRFPFVKSTLLKI